MRFAATRSSTRVGFAESGRVGEFMESIVASASRTAIPLPECRAMSRVLFRAALVAVLLAAAPAFAQDAALIRLAPAAPEDAKGDRGSVFFVGTATVIIRYAGFTILTD